MDRRELLTGLSALSAVRFAAGRASAAAPGANSQPLELTRSGRITSKQDGEVIQGLDIRASAGHAIVVLHRGVTIRACRIGHAGGHGIHASGAAELVVEDVEIDNAGAPPSGAGPKETWNNVNVETCPGTRITRLKASRGASNIYMENSAGSHLSLLELHDARGPEPRGQNVQLNKCPDSVVEDFSGENHSLSWTEDNVSVFRSDGCAIRRGLVFYNNSPTGDGIMLEGSFDCTVEDVDALQQGNGAFAAVPGGSAGSGGCTFARCRTRNSYNGPRDGRARPTSGGLSIYVRISPDARKHTIAGCEYDALANPRNLIWDLRAVNPGWSFVQSAFTPRPPIRLMFPW